MLEGSCGSMRFHYFQTPNNKTAALNQYAAQRTKAYKRPTPRPHFQHTMRQPGQAFHLAPWPAFYTTFSIGIGQTFFLCQTKKNNLLTFGNILEINFWQKTRPTMNLYKRQRYLGLQTPLKLWPKTTTNLYLMYNTGRVGQTTGKKSLRPHKNKLRYSKDWQPGTKTKSIKNEQTKRSTPGPPRFSQTDRQPARPRTGIYFQGSKYSRRPAFKRNGCFAFMSSPGASYVGITGRPINSHRPF